MRNPTRTGPADSATSALENLFHEHLENPFLILALPVSASATEVERQGQKWLSMLAAGLVSAQVYATPFGPRARSPEQVRVAMAELASPARRLAHEWWARGWSLPEASP
jgi:hypothetical protein